MEIIRNIEKTRMVVKCAATIGVFDGVHAGHRQVIKHLVSTSRFPHLASMVITFDRHPRQLFDPDFRPQLLTTQEEKEREIERLGVDFLVVLPFTKEIAQLSARDFMAQILKEKLNVKSLQIGYDNRFGHDRTEGFDDYRRYGQELGINVYRGIKLSFQNYDFAICSSNIRSLLADDGDIETATIMLEHPYQLSGKVMPGEHIGHLLGFPTANIEPDDPFKVIPAAGVYAVWAQVADQTTLNRRLLHEDAIAYSGGEVMPAMMNIGTRPTFEGRNRTLEVNILDFDGNLYGKTILITFVARLREERKFESPEALARQLEEDQKATERCLLVNRTRVSAFTKRSD
ncbi:MAG: bifunctional riboflavin kinase/FAD synthetase [Prevotella sp.]|nr:bifunctional riboflavin kinase/FAD synthetase [Prevotella sp.]MBR3658240.1 bifunctional riboflavin kinase/FAD synthetase [Prevotella sp.]